MRNEIFKPHPEYSSYLVSTAGRVFSVKSFMYLKHSKGKTGYPFVTINHAGQFTRLVHRLVLETFVGLKPEGYQCAHLNGKRTDARLKNLKWVTPKENTSHKERHGTSQRGERSGPAKLTDAIVKKIRAEYRRTSYHKSNARELGIKFGVDRNTIRRVVSRRYWSHI